MKKQILVLAFLLAGLANVNLSFGQALVPRKVTCLTADALHPIAGTPFTYQIDVPATPTGGTAWTSLNYLWYVTQDQNFITLNAGVPTLTAAANRQTDAGLLLKKTDANYNLASSTSNSISLTWKSFYYDPTVPIFVVISVTGSNGLCDPMNLKVFKIEPQNAFTIDIDNLKEDGTFHTPPVYNALGVLQPGGAYGDLYEQCISPIQSAIYSPTAPAGIVYDFGQNIMMYEVVAANWYTSWRPSFTLTGIDPKETIKVEYSKDKTFAVPADIVTMSGPAKSAAIATVLTYTTTASITASAAATTGFVDDKGESIYVRVTLDHSNGTAASYEGLADEKIALAVDGLTNLAVAGKEVGDVHTTAGTTLPAQACPWVDGFANDIAYQTLKGRPTITSSTVGVAPNENPIGNLLPVKP